MSISRLAPSREKAALVAGRLRSGCRETAKRMQGEQFILEAKSSQRRFPCRRHLSLTPATVSWCPISIGTPDFQQQNQRKTRDISDSSREAPRSLLGTGRRNGAETIPP